MLERLENQKKLTANQWKITAIANVGDMLDFFDFFLIGYVLAFILRDWQLADRESRLILASAGPGAVPDAFFWGWMGNRIGRRTGAPRPLLLKGEFALAGTARPNPPRPFGLRCRGYIARKPYA
jgi:MFS family permease